MSDFTMDADHPGLAMDRGVQGVLGAALDRSEGALKVSGAALPRPSAPRVIIFSAAG